MRFIIALMIGMMCVGAAFANADLFHAALNAGDAAKERGDIVGAEQQYRLAVSRMNDVEPEWGAAAMTLLGSAIADQDRYSEAEAIYRQALSYSEQNVGSESSFVATILNNLASVLEDQGRYAAAEPLYKRTLDIRRKTWGPNHPEVALGLNNLASLYHSQGRHADAEPLYREALAIRERLYDASHPDLLVSINNLASLYHDQGRLENAKDLYSQVLSVRERLLGPKHPDIASSLNNLATIYDAQGRYADAESFYKRSLSIYEHAYGEHDPKVAISLSNLASLYENVGRYAESESLLLRALIIAEKIYGPDHPDVATKLNNLALTYESQGRYTEAESLYRRILAIDEKTFGPEHPDFATGLNNLASIYLSQGRYADVEPLYRRALDINKKAFGNGHPSVALSLNNLGNLYVGLGRYDEAEQLIQSAGNIYVKLYGDERPGPGMSETLNNLATLYQAQNRYAEAESLLRSALAIDEKLIGREHPAIANTLSNLGEAVRAQGRYTDAESIHLLALSIRKKALGPNHPDLASSYHHLARLRLEAGKPIEALNYQRQANNILRARFSTVGTDTAVGRRSEQRARSGSFAWHASLIGAILPYAPVAERPGLIAEAFEMAQLARTNDTSAILAQMAARVASGNQEIAAIVRERQDEIARGHQLEKRLIAMLSKPPSQGSETSEKLVREQLAATEQRIAQLSGKVQQSFPAYQELTQPLPLSISDAQKLIAPNEALISWLVLDKEILMFLVRSDQAKLVRIEQGLETLRLQIKRLRLATEFPPTGALPAYPHEIAFQLYRSLLGPAENHLAGVNHLILVPEGPLESLSFAMLETYPITGAPPAKQIPWLAKRYALTTLPGVTPLRALHFDKKNKLSPEPFVGFGDPVLNGNGLGTSRSANVTIANLFSRGAIADTRAVMELPPLPETANELRTIANTLGASPGSLHLRGDATETQVKGLPLHQYRIVAFATHGLMAADFSGLAEPALVLTPPLTATEKDDGLLTASEVASLKLAADWVVLSACNTAASDGTPGATGFSGLTKAFFYAGAKTLLVSHWAVETKSAAAITTKLFSEVKKGLSKAEALRKAMIALADRSETSHPAFWAPFILVGDWR